MKWYVVHTYSGYEAKAKQSLEERAKQMKLGDLIGQVLIPSEQVVEMVGGQRRTTSRKFFPGYILVKMILTEESWHLVKSTPKVTGFVGGMQNPTPIPEEDVDRITQKITEGTLRPKPKIEFEKGENVRVMTGPFANFTGVVEEVRPDKSKLRVMVSIFGRATPVELDFYQVEKT
ncbi:MAG: transcription termination/antitermination protein NusG [Deltaproteobacteria bacterium]|nr:transcription termination/antitermination protein NusG [Deltaproteobacteria bacterium]